MDHLPYPNDAVYPQIQIPYLAPRAVTVYHGDNFIDFPAQAGWEDGSGDWFHCEPPIAAARAQSWLFFGLLREVIGPTFSESSFIASDDAQKQFVSTKTSLPPLLEKRFRSRQPVVANMFEDRFYFFFIFITTLGTILFKTELRHHLSGTRKKLLSRYRVAMIKAEDEVRSIEAAFPDCDDVHLVCLSIRALLWSLRNAVANQDLTIMKRSALELSSSPYLKRLLIERGICPHYLATIEERSSVVLLHYLAGLDRPIGPHGDCTDQSCCANILDPSKYKAKHVDDDCECNPVESNIAEVLGAIDVGEVPVIRVSLRGAEVHIDTQRAAFDNPYVAISHVWSGGLGNQRASSLPACQLRRIYHILRPLVKPLKGVSTTRWREIVKLGLSDSEKDVERGEDLPPVTKSCVFWMDTLCLPKQKPQRNLAINQMNRIYAEAQQVVVLDHDIRKIGIDRQEEEILANLVSSAWMSRCWTFQEGRLAQQLLINIDHSLRDPFAVYNQVAKEVATYGPGRGIWSDTLQLRRELASGLYRMRPMKDERTRSTELDYFADIWNEMVSRTTSRAEDEIKILTLMLDLSVTELESISGDDLRLKAVFRTQEELPLSFLFTETLSDRGNNDEIWLPENLTATTYISGCMRKTMDVGIGEPGLILNLDSDRCFLMKSTSCLSGRFHDIWIREDDDEQADYTINLAFPEAVPPQTLSYDSGANISAGHLYLFHMSGPLAYETSSFSGRGCRFNMIQEESTYMAVAYDLPFSYTAKHATEIMDAAGRVGPQSQLMKPIVRQMEVRLRCDWTQWPLLQYHRSRTIKQMTTSHKPTHPYAFWLFQWEFIMGFGAIIIVLVTFPSDANNGVQPSAGNWVIYAFCLTLLFCRLLYVLFKEIPTLNRLLRLTEYQKWTKSFAHPTGDMDGYRPKSPLTRVYQYRPWWVTVCFIALGIGLLASGVIIDGANLFEMPIAGGYLIGVISVIAMIEAFSRYPGMKNSKQRLLNRLFGEYPIGYDSYNILKLFSTEPDRSVTHSKRNLDLAFGDPLYLHEGYRWEKI